MRIQPVAIVLLVISVLFLIVAFFYLTKTANHLPSFMPGRPSAQQLKLDICNAKHSNRPCFTPRKFTKRGIAAVGLAVVCLVGAWYTSGLRKSSTEEAAA